MADLVAYLRARLDEEEAAALEADARQWTVGPDGEIVHIDPAWAAGPGVSVIGTVRLTVDPAYADDDDLRHGRQTHIVRWSPARVLAEVAAKRAILDLHQMEHYDGYHDKWTKNDAADYCTTCVQYDNCEVPYPCWPCATLLALAQPYAARPDFPAEWKAETTNG